MKWQLQLFQPPVSLHQIDINACGLIRFYHLKYIIKKATCKRQPTKLTNYKGQIKNIDKKCAVQNINSLYNRFDFNFVIKKI